MENEMEAGERSTAQKKLRGLKNLLRQYHHLQGRKENGMASWNRCSLARTSFSASALHSFAASCLNKQPNALARFGVYGFRV